MSTVPTATSTLTPGEGEVQAWPLLPVETEIYILPDGRVVVADLPAELAPLLAALGVTASPDTVATGAPLACHE